mmetsp:Transcript_283/g.1176  ORF Transcript_283/g.1176 Transcript_283/m.1176 type:complete len:269 (+) Transcript_283:1175-1981(+)
MDLTSDALNMSPHPGHFRSRFSSRVAMQSLQNMWKHRVITTPFGRSLHTEQRNMDLYASISSLYSSALPPCLASFSHRRRRPAHVSSHFASARSASATLFASSFATETSVSARRSAFSKASRRLSEVSRSCVRVFVCSSIRRDTSSFSSIARASSSLCSRAAASICCARVVAACAAPRSCATAACMPAHSSRSRRAAICAWFFSASALVELSSRSASRSMSLAFSEAASSYAAPIASISAMNASDSAFFSSSAASDAEARALAAEASR